MIKNLLRFIKYKDKQSHQKWVWTQVCLHSWTRTFQPLSSPDPSSAGDREKDWVPHRNLASTNTFCPTIHSGLSLSSGNKVYLLEALPTSWTRSQIFASGGQSIVVSALTPVLPMNSQGWFPLGCTGWIFLQSKGLSRVVSNTTDQKHQFFDTQLFFFF